MLVKFTHLLPYPWSRYAKAVIQFIVAVIGFLVAVAGIVEAFSPKVALSLMAAAGFLATLLVEKTPNALNPGQGAEMNPTGIVKAFDHKQFQKDLKALDPNQKEE